MNCIFFVERTLQSIMLEIVSLLRHNVIEVVHVKN